MTRAASTADERHRRRGGRAVRRACASALAALAAAALVPAAVPAQVPASPDATAWVTNGPVYAVAHAGDRTFIGGDFSRVGPRTGPGAALSPDTANPPGAPNLALPEIAGGEVLAVIADGAGGWYVGGDFTHVAGEFRPRLAHIRGSGALDTSFNPNPNGTVRALALGVASGRDAGVLYVGGAFRSIDGQSRDFLAALNSAGQALSWNPQPDNEVHALAATTISFDVTVGTPTPTDMPVVFVGGTFAKMGTPGTQALVAVWGEGSVNRDNVGNAGTVVAGSGTTTWTFTGSVTGPVRALAIGPPKTSGSNVARAIYAAGDFTSLLSRARLVAIQFQVATTGSSAGNVTAPATYASWNPTTPVFPFRALALGPAPAGRGTLYVGGDFTGNIGAPSAAPRDRIAAFLGVPDPTVTTGTNGASPLPEFDPKADARVRALAVSPDGQAVYAGGDFRKIGSVGVGEAQPARDGLAALATSNGTATAWNPSPSGGLPEPRVNALAVAPATGVVYAGGMFTSVGAARRENLAALDASGALVQGWDAGGTACTPVTPPTTCRDAVRALSVADGTLYVGGDFDQAGGLERSRLAAFDAVDGTLKAWNPSANCVAPPCSPNPSVLALTALSGTVYVGGAFTTVKGERRTRLAAIDAASGDLLPWNPGADDNVYALSPGCSTVYVGGGFERIGGAQRENLAALDPATGAATPWNPEPSSVVYALAFANGVVYAGGIFPMIGGAVRQKVAALDPVTGRATKWNPSASAGSSVTALAVPPDGSVVYAGGTFYSIGGADRSKIAALDPASGDATPWNPGANGTVRALAASGSGLYAGGEFKQVASSMQEGFAAFGGGPGGDLSPVRCASSSSGGGGGGGGGDDLVSPPESPRDTLAPRITRFKLTRARFRVARRATPIVARAAARRRLARRVRAGTTFVYRVSEPGTARIVIQRRTVGRRVRGRCRAVTRRSRRGRRCARYRSAGRLTRTVVAGTNRVPFTGRIGRRTLRPGAYRATIVATDAAGNRSRPKRLRFTVVASPSRARRAR